MSDVPTDHNPYPVDPTGFLVGSYIAVSTLLPGRRIERDVLTKIASTVYLVRYAPDPGAYVFHDIFRSDQVENPRRLGMLLEHVADGHHHGRWMEVFCGDVT